MSQPCSTCSDQAKERNWEMDNLLIKAKIQAVETNKPKAICEDPVQGLFITEAGYAVREFSHQIKHIVSPVQ